MFDIAAARHCANQQGLEFPESRLDNLFGNLPTLLLFDFQQRSWFVFKSAIPSYTSCGQDNLSLVEVVIAAALAAVAL